MSQPRKWRYLISDAVNSLLYRKIGTVKNNVLTEDGVDLYTVITAEKCGPHSIRFTYTIVDPFPFVIDKTDDGQVMVGSIHKDLPFHHEWDLSEPRFNSIRHIELAKEHVSAPLYILRKLFKGADPDIGVAVDAEKITFTHRPSLTIEFLEFKDNVLHFKFTFSSNMESYIICSDKFEEVPLSKFKTLSEQTTLNIIKERGGISTW